MKAIRKSTIENLISDIKDAQKAEFSNYSALASRNVKMLNDMLMQGEYLDMIDPENKFLLHAIAKIENKSIEIIAYNFLINSEWANNFKNQFN